jgi:hypothetical protein
MVMAFIRDRSSQWWWWWMNPSLTAGPGGSRNDRPQGIAAT